MKYQDLSEEAKQVAHDWMLDNTELMAFCDKAEEAAVQEAWHNAGFIHNEYGETEMNKVPLEIDYNISFERAKVSINTRSGNVGITAVAELDGSVHYEVDLRQVDLPFIDKKLSYWCEKCGEVAEDLLKIYSWNFREQVIEEYAKHFEFNQDGTVSGE